MPILPDNRDRYPKDWALRSRFVRFVRARGRCEWCGVAQYSVISKDGSILDGPCASYAEARYRALELWGSVVVLTTAHVYDDRPEASSLLNLAALCQRCHNSHDAAARRAGTRARRREALAVGDLFA